jgi:hypothetical protein
MRITEQYRLKWRVAAGDRPSLACLGSEALAAAFNGVDLASNKTPEGFKEIPFTIFKSPLVAKQSPLIIFKSPLGIFQTPFAVSKSPLDILLTLFTISKTSLIVLVTPKIIFQTQKIISKSPFALKGVCFKAKLTDFRIGLVEILDKAWQSGTSERYRFNFLHLWALTPTQMSSRVKTDVAQLKLCSSILKTGMAG